MKKLIFLLLLFTAKVSFSQSIGYEMRSNGRSYVMVGYDHFELRHRTDLSENRITYRYNLNFNHDKMCLSVPLHYKIEKNHPTLEPRLVYKMKNCSVWVQQEFDLNELDNLAVAVDVPYKNYRFRAGWDTSKTIRFRFLIKL